MRRRRPEPPEDEGRAAKAVAGVAWALAMAVLALLPWRYGSAEAPFAWSVTLAAGVLLVVLAARVLLQPPPGDELPLAAGRSYRLAAWALAAFVLVILFQTLPLPRGLLAVLSPAADRWHVAAGPATLSLDPGATRASLLRFLSALAFLFAPLVLVSSSRRIRFTLGFWTCLGGVAATYALLAHLSKGEISFHFDAHIGRAREPFVNPNHLATWLALILPAPLAVLLLTKPKARARDMEPFAARLADFFADLSKRYWKILAALAFVFVALALVFTLSRGGLVAAGVGLAVFLAVFSALRRKRLGVPAGRMLLGTGIACVVVGTAAWIGLGPLLTRFGQAAELGMGDRAKVWAGALDLWRDAPLFGTGLGTFVEAFPRFQEPALAARFTYPHNEFVGLLAESGILGLLFLAAAAALTLAGLLKDLAVREFRRPRQLAASWALGALAAAAIHSFTDFSVRIPAVGCTLAFFLGLGLASVRKPVTLRSRAQAADAGPSGGAALGGEEPGAPAPPGAPPSGPKAPPPGTDHDA